MEPPSHYSIMGKHRLPVDENGFIYWTLMNFGEDMDHASQINVMWSAFQRWEKLLWPWQFQSVSNDKDVLVDVWKIYHVKSNKIQLPGKVMRSPFNFAKSPETLAVQWAYYPGFEWSLSMVINDDHEFSLNYGKKQFKFLDVITHEMGHGLRLGHSEAPGELMNPYYAEGMRITQDSIDGLMAVHGEHLKEFHHLPRVKRFVKLMKDVEMEELKNNPGCNPFKKVKTY